MKVTGAKPGKRGVRTIRGRKGGRRGGARRPRRGGPQNERRKKHRNGKAQENAGAAGGRGGGRAAPGLGRSAFALPPVRCGAAIPAPLETQRWRPAAFPQTSSFQKIFKNI